MASLSLQTATALFKENYAKRSEQTYNTANVLLGRIEKKYDFTGKTRVFEQDIGFQGGVGSGSLPDFYPGSYVTVSYAAKKVYARAQLDRESIKAAQDDKGAFVRLTKENVKKAVEAYMWNCSRILFGEENGDGRLGTGDGVTNVSGAGTTGSPYVFRISDASWNEAHWEENNYINIDTETTPLVIVDVDPATKDISVVGTSAILAADTGATPLVESVYLQKSKDNDPTGLRYILSQTSGTLYGANVARRWRAAVYEDNGAAGISIDTLNQDLLEIKRKSGKTPNLIMTSYTQFRKLQNLIEDKKRYPLPVKSGSMKGQFAFSGLEFMSDNGPIPIFPERFCNPDEVFYLNDNYIMCDHRPGFGWFDDDNTVYLRVADSDEYEARYGGYYENYIIPSFHGMRYNFSL